MLVFLVGFMGSGKTSLARRLARRMEFEFLDSDHSIEDQQGMSIPEIFESKGEEEFRRLEREWLENIDMKNAVISVGGGTFCSQENVDLINKLGTSIYIHLPIGMLTDRLRNSNNPRPLIQPYKDDKEALTDFVGSKLEDRLPFYKQAKIHFEGGDITATRIDQLVELINLSSSVS